MLVTILLTASIGLFAGLWVERLFGKSFSKKEPVPLPPSLVSDHAPPPKNKGCAVHFPYLNCPCDEKPLVTPDSAGCASMTFTMDPPKDVLYVKDGIVMVNGKELIDICDKDPAPCDEPTCGGDTDVDVADPDPLCGASNRIANECREYFKDHMSRLTLSRKLLRKKQLKPGENVMVIRRDPAAIGITTPRRGGVPEHVNEGDDIFSKPFEIACHPTIKDSKFISDPDGEILELKKGSFRAMKLEEDSNTLSLFREAVAAHPDQMATRPTIDRSAMTAGFQKVEQHGYKVTHVIISSPFLSKLRENVADFKDAGMAEYLKTGVNGYLWGAEVHASGRMELEDILFVAAPMAGSYGVRASGVRAIPSPQENKLRQAVIVTEEIAMAINTPWAIGMVRIEEPKVPPTVTHEDNPMGTKVCKKD